MIVNIKEGLSANNRAQRSTTIIVKMEQARKSDASQTLKTELPRVGCEATLKGHSAKFATNNMVLH